MWLKLAETVKNEHTHISFCNLQFEKKVGENFKKLRDKKNFSHPFHWARYQRVPFAIVYRDGWPQGFYNGGFFLQDLLTFVIDKVSNPYETFEKVQKIRPDLISSLRKREIELLDELDQEREEEDELMERKQLRETNTREQVIAHAVDFD